MRIDAERLQGALTRGLAAFYLISGDEPLLVAEATDLIRAAARKSGYDERIVAFVDRYFDWEELRGNTQALSLFATRRLFELRMPSGKPDKGAELLQALASSPPPDVVTLVITDKLERKVSDAPWIRAAEQHGVWVTVRAVETAALPAWLRTRAKTFGAEIDAEAAALIADRVEGNLLAARQELEKLSLLADGKPIDAALVLRAVGDSARFDVFQLSQAAAEGDARRALRVLMGLQSEGVEPTLILWALLREIRGMWQARERQRLNSAVRGSAWNVAATPSSRAMARMKTVPLAELLVQASQTDRVIKGVAMGDPWNAIFGLTAAFAGALQATVDSGRVAP